MKCEECENELRKKQIEEMAKFLHPDRCFDNGITECRKIEDCDICKANRLYNAGYRKQSEVERLIETLERKIGTIYNRYVFEDTDYADDDVAIEAVMNALTDVSNEIDELKKKYTGK